MARAAVLLGSAAALAAAFALGTRFGGNAERVVIERDARPAMVTPVTMAVRPSTNATVTADQVRAIVREELATEREDGDTATGDPQVVAAREESAIRARQVVARAIEQRTWSERDRDELLAAMRNLDSSQANAILGELFPALNDGRVTLTYAGAPL